MIKRGLPRKPRKSPRKEKIVKEILMRKKLGLLCLLLAALMLFCAACETTEDTAVEATVTPGAETAVDTPADDTVIAKIGETQSVSYGELLEYYEYYVELMSYYGSTVPETDEEIESLQDSLLEDLINQAKLLYYAEQYGLTVLTEEEEAEVREMVSEEMESYMEEFRAEAEEEGATDVETRARELFDADLEAYGVGMDSYEYEEYIYQLYAEDFYLDKLENYVKENATVTEEEISAYYETLVTDQTSEYGEDPTLYGDDEEYYEKYGGVPGVVVPEGYVRVKAISILPEGTLGSEYTEKTDKMAEYEAEYGKLALTDAEGNAKRLGDLQTLYAALKLETETMYEEYIATVRVKAQEAYDALTAGTAFDTVLITYGQNADYINYPTLLEKGSLLYLGEGTEDNAALTEAVKALTPGQYSEIIVTDNTYYIVYLVGEEPAGTKALTEVYDAVQAAALEEKAETVWSEQQETWSADDSIVTTYPEIYRSVGK